MIDDAPISTGKGRAPAPRGRRSLGVLRPFAVLAVLSLLFYARQNFSGQLGGRMSLAKLLWLDYALAAWFVLPFTLWRSPRVAPALRRVYGAHLFSFAARGAAELWMLYVTISWLPPYGIAHDLFTIGLITLLLRLARGQLTGLNNRANRSARGFLTSIRLGLGCEILFAWMFYRATGGQIGIYFASDDPVFAVINRLTWAVVLVAYADLLRVLWTGRDLLFPRRSSRESGVEHA
jgi:hypothetical protein